MSNKISIHDLKKKHDEFENWLKTNQKAGKSVAGIMLTQSPVGGDEYQFNFGGDYKSFIGLIANAIADFAELNNCSAVSLANVILDEVKTFPTLRDEVLKQILS